MFKNLIDSATRRTRQALADRVFDELQSFFATGRSISAAPTARETGETR